MDKVKSLFDSRNFTLQTSIVEDNTCCEPSADEIDQGIEKQQSNNAAVKVKSVIVKENEEKELQI